jgi:DNA-binding XRE family transcriptional regulator
MKYRKPPAERFHGSYIPEPNSGCWLWTERMSPEGYGVISVNGKPVYAHRYSQEIHNGHPGDLHVCHKCDTRSCVNPNHLFLGTRFDNIQDCVRKGRLTRKLTPERARELRVARQTEGLSYSQLAKRFGVTKQSVYAIVKNYSYPEAA